MKIAAGLGKNKNIVEAAADVDFEVILTESEEELSSMLLNNKVDGAVRGSLSSTKILNVLRKEHNQKIYRASLLELKGHKFLLAPVGIDEVDTLQDKQKIVELGTEFLSKLGIEPKIGVISGTRLEDSGRSPKIDYFIEESLDLIEKIKNKFFIKEYLLNEAIKDNANIILAPDGISGNLIFRSLVFLGATKSYGAVSLGMDKIFIDTSRSQTVEGYKRALELSHYLAKLKHT